MRLFVAIALPNDVKEALGDVIDRLRPSAPDEKWVPSQNLHATIAFLGEVGDKREASISDALRGVVVERAPCSTRTTGAGAFPSQRRARVLWTGLADDDGCLAASAAAVVSALEPVGFAPEKRAWAPHVTLARFRAPRDVSAMIVTADVPALGFTVEEVTLYRSRLARPAPVYEAVARFPLGG